METCHKETIQQEEETPSALSLDLSSVTIYYCCLPLPPLIPCSVSGGPDPILMLLASPLHTS
jgi:hypothetical protein